MNHSVLSRSLLPAGLLLLASYTIAIAAGPSDRVATDPNSIASGRQAGSKPVDVADVVQTVHIAGASVSPDGRQIAYSGDASGRLNLWIMNADGQGARQLLRSNERQVNPVFTHDGRELVYVQDTGGDELYDLYVVSAGGGEPRNLTRTDKVSEFSPRFSPDGTRLAISSKDKIAPMVNLAALSWPDGAAQLLTHEKDPKASWAAACWSPDGKFLFAVRRVGLDDSDVYRVDAVSGAAENLTAHTGKLRFAVSDVSPDGTSLLMTSNEKGGYFNVALFTIASKQKRWITDTQWEADGGSFAADGKTFTYTLNADGRTTLYFVDAVTLKAGDRALPPGLNDEAGWPRSFLPDSRSLVTHQDATHAANLYLTSADGPPRQLTHTESGGLAAAVLPRSQVISYKSFDGRMISAFLWMPFNLKRDHSAAAVVLPHGGPTGQTADRFDSRAVMLVSRGFVVLAPNVRGSTGYGMEFQQANFKDLGGADLKDEIAGVDFLNATGFVSTKKIGIWGGSYGGFMTLMAIGKTPGIWSAAVDEYGILNWYTMLSHEDPSLQEYEKSLLGDPEKDRGVYEASSPLKYIRQERAPLLVLQGERDIRVPKEEAEQVVAILKAEGRTVDAVYYPDEGHGFLKREHKLDELKRSVQWLERYLQDKPPG
ncbi:MAG: S9 family peptidase [Gammaproteobacteria bacterium]